MRLAVWLCAVLGSCALASGPSVPGDLVDLPWQGGPGDAGALEARQLADRGRPREALAVLDEVLDNQPRHVDAHRLRQDLLRERGRLGRVLREAELRIDEWGDDAAANYLRGRVLRDDADKMRHFVTALERDRRSFWPWLGLAFLYRTSDPQRALLLYDQLYRASRGHPLVAVAYGSALRATGSDQLALQVYNALRGNDQLPGVGDLGVAETHLYGDRRREAWAPLLESLRQRPWDGGLRRILEALIAQGMPRGQLEQLLAVLWEDPERATAFRAAGGGPLLAALLERVGAIPGAFEVLRTDLAVAPEAIRRHERRLTLAVGDVRGFLDSLAASRPAELMADERNQVRGLWLAVTDGPWRTAADPLADPVDTLDLTRALVGAGLLVEAELMAGLGMSRHRQPAEFGAAFRTIRDEVRREIAFEGALRRMLYRGYAGEPKSIEEFLDDLRRVSRDVLGRDVVGDPSAFDVPFVGRLIDPFGPGLAEHLRGYNRHLVLGQRIGGPPEGMLVTRVALRYLDAGGPLALAGRCWEVVGEDREIESIQGVLGGDLAGVALLNHYVIDLDAVRDWGDSIRARREILREDGGALLADPLPVAVGATEPVDVAWRLAALSPVEDTELDAAVLDMIRWHERAHLVDSFRYLPPESNLWRVLGLLIEHGFSAASIEAEMEGRAETAALAFSPHTHLVLAHIAGFLENPNSGSPHGSGFARLARRLNKHLAVDAELAPFASASRWHEIPSERIRQIARELARELWP